MTDFGLPGDYRFFGGQFPMFFLAGGEKLDVGFFIFGRVLLRWAWRAYCSGWPHSNCSPLACVWVQGDFHLDFFLQLFKHRFFVGVF